MLVLAVHRNAQLAVPCVVTAPEPAGVIPAVLVYWRRLLGVSPSPNPCLRFLLASANRVRLFKRNAPFPGAEVGRQGKWLLVLIWQNGLAEVMGAVRRGWQWSQKSAWRQLCY